MSRTRWALLLLGSIAALLVALLVLIPRRPVFKTPETLREEPPAAAPRQEPPAIAPRQEPRVEARLAVVIDDVGYSLVDLAAFLDLPGPLTFSVLPNLPQSGEAARLIVAAGKELLLHVPMEPEGGADPGPGAIRTDQSDAQIEEQLASDFARFPQAVGMNNHMGSRATADERVMAVVLRALRKRGLFFLDSRTTTATRAEEVGGRLLLPVLARDVFLDNENSAAYIRGALRRGTGIALRRGQAVLIGHVQNGELARELALELPRLENRGVRLVPLSELAASDGQAP